MTGVYTPATTPGTATDASATGTAGTSSGGSSGATPTTSDSGVSGESSGGGTTGQVSASSSGGTTGDGSSGGESSGGFKLDLPVPDKPIPVHDIPGLKSITFYETTGMVTEYTFTVDGPELNNQLADPLTQQNRDIQGTGVEFYDVYYSEEDGTFNADGSYLTIAGSFGAKLPAGGGLNLAEISLNSAIAA